MFNISYYFIIFIFAFDNLLFKQASIFMTLIDWISYEMGLLPDLTSNVYDYGKQLKTEYVYNE